MLPWQKDHMRILVCTDNFYPGIGGTEAAVLGYAEALVRMGHEILLACPEYGSEGERDYSFPVVRFPSFRIIKNNPIALTHISRKKWKALIDFSPEIVHLQTLSGMAKVGLRAGYKLHVPVVMTMHTKILEAYRLYIRSECLARLFLRTQIAKVKSCDALVTVADCMLDELKSYHCPHADFARVIRNGAPFEKDVSKEEARAIARRKLGIGEAENVLLFVGRLIHYKKVTFVLHCLKIAHERGFRFKYFVVGDGEDASSMRREANRLGISDSVIFTGRISDRTCLQQYYVAADLFVLASMFDNDPIVVLEAASKGVPSLVVEHSGCSERITDGVNGFTAPLEEAAFSARLTDVFSDKDNLRKVGKKAAESVLSTWEDTVRAYFPLYEALAAKKLKELSGGGYISRAVTEQYLHQQYKNRRTGQETVA